MPDLTAKSLWYAAAGRADIRDEPLGALAAGSVRVRALHSAISRGTERLVFSGGVPESEYQRMRAPFMAGSFPFPVKYGYAMVGRTEQGQTVFALHPHQTVFDLAVAAVTPVPDGVPPRRAVLAANMETALNALWDAAPGPADRIAVVGAGVVGALVAYLCGRLPGAQVTLVDIDASRAELARALGVSFAAPDQAPADCDLVVHASGSAAGLKTALGLAGEEATVLEMSWYGTNDIAAPLGGAFHTRRLRLISSQVGKVAPSHRPRWSYARRLSAALDLLKDEKLDALLATSIKFADLPLLLPDILSPQGGVLCQVVDYPNA